MTKTINKFISAYLHGFFPRNLELSKENFLEKNKKINKRQYLMQLILSQILTIALDPKLVM